MTTIWKIVSALTFVGVIILLVGLFRPQWIGGAPLYRYVGFGLLNGVLHRGGMGIMMWPPQSPIHTANIRWNQPSNGNPSVTSTPVTQNGTFNITLYDNSRVLGTWSNVAAPWQISFAGPGDSNNSAMINISGLSACASYQNGFCLTNASSGAVYVSVTPTAFIPAPSGGGACTVNPSSDYAPFCESVGIAVVSVGGKQHRYICLDGECRVEIGPSNSTQQSR